MYSGTTVFLFLVLIVHTVTSQIRVLTILNSVANPIEKESNNILKRVVTADVLRGSITASK